MNNMEYENEYFSDSKGSQRRRYIESEYSIVRVQSFINNIGFPTSLDELYFYATEHGCFNVEDILNEYITTWTVPRWAKIGDIVFFMHTKTAKSTITRLRTELYSEKNNISKKRFDILSQWINKGLSLYNSYGGKIFAIGRVVGAPEYIDNSDSNYEDASYYHWKSRLYADIELHVLENPIDISEFNSFIFVSRQGAVTGIFGKEYDKLKSIIKNKNVIPSYFEHSISSPLPLSNINPENWIQLTSEYRRSFMLESQFRSYYVDYLLKSISAHKRLYKECRCKKGGMADSFVDNVIMINGKYLPVEVKLSVAAEADINSQLKKYCHDDCIIVSKKRTVLSEKVHIDNVLVIDTDNIYMYQYSQDNLKQISSLNAIIKEADIMILKEKICRYC